jgi:hypothetical protein
MTGQAKILAVDDEPDFEALLKQRFRRQIRSNEYAFRFAHHGEGAGRAGGGSRVRAAAARHQTCR